MKKMPQFMSVKYLTLGESQKFKPSNDKKIRMHTEVVTAETIMLLKPYMDKTLTITTDNGKELLGTK
jgi:hypothetical protein